MALRHTLVVLVATSTAAIGLTSPATAAGRAPAAHPGPRPVPTSLPKVPVMTGGGGAVSSVDADASRVGIDVLKAGGNATDAAIATAAALGVTEPYTSGIGGGGFFVHYDARTGRVQTIDGRESAPMSFTENTLRRPDGSAMDFWTVVSSGLSVGVPGTPATWDLAARTWGTRPLGTLLRPAEQIARRGFVVDQSFHDLTAENAARFRLFPETERVFLRDGEAPAVGSVFRNPDMARTYRELRTHGVESLYRGRMGAALVAEARAPHTAPGVSVPAGEITRGDLAAYRPLRKAPTHTTYRGRDVYGMPVPSSGGIAVGEILNLLEAYDARTGVALKDVSNVQYLHRLSEASATAFADRNRYVGDVPQVPTTELMSQRFADERACLFDSTRAMPRPVPFGSPDGSYGGCDKDGRTQPAAADGRSTTHLSVVDRWGNAVAYTLTIEQYGGSGITVPGWGFLLNNELTDFDFVPLQAGVPDPNRPGPGKRPRSSMSPTMVVEDGRLVLVAGSPGGATIITTVAQVVTEHLDRGQALVDAINAPRLSSRNGSSESAEPALIDSADGRALVAMGHRLALTPVIGNATGVRVLSPRRLQAAAETWRRGGGSAMVVRPTG